MQEITGVLALVISIIALAVSGILAYRQVALMSRANQLPLMIDLIRELRSPDFLERERFVNEELVHLNPHLGYSNLPPFAADNLQHVKSLFNSIGSLVAFRVIDERAAISIFGYRASRAWRSMAPFVESERRIRAGNYAPYFEHFVAIVRATTPEQITTDLGLKKV